MGLVRRPSHWVLLLLIGIVPPAAQADDDDASEFGGTPQVLVTASRLGDGLVGSATSVVSAADIAADPASDLPQILARQSGIQLQSLFGAVNGAQASIGLRGFGATASENTLILVNGRRVNDPDQSGIDFSAIPNASIERIEITRGNSASVLYGDGAVGGVINIITKNGDNSEPGSFIEGSLGSFQYRSLDVSTNQKFGGTSLSAYGSEIVSNGYRDNNSLRERNFDAEIRQDIAGGVVYLNIRGDDQYLGLPGSIPLSQARQAPKSTNNLFDYGGLQSVNATLGVTHRLSESVELILDGGIRHKEEQSQYEAFNSFYGIDVTTWSLTPRVNINSQISDIKSELIAGIDFYQSFYRSFDSEFKGAVPYQNNLLAQRTLAIYGEENLSLSPSTTLGFGLRLQRADLSARQKIDYFAPQASGSPGAPLTQTDDEFAAHWGIEQKIGETLTLFARLGHAMRLPNMDDRNFVAVYPTNFRLKTQTSEDGEIGVAANWGRISGQTRIYGMFLHHEIDYDPGANGGFGANVNLDPTERKGWETEVNFHVTPELSLNANGSVTAASFRSGPYRGEEVPQISLLSGNLGLSWNIWQNYLVFDGALRAIGKRRLGDDFLGQQKDLPGNAMADAKLSGVIDRLHWSIAAQNLFDKHVNDLGYFSGGAIGVYPLPGREWLFRLGVAF